MFIYEADESDIFFFESFILSNQICYLRLMPLETNIKPPNPTVLQNFSFFVLGLVALIKLIFLAVARMMLCFGFVTNTVLIRHQCFRYCQTVLTQQQQGLLCFSHYPLPYGIILSNKSWGNEEGKTVAFQVFVFPSNPYV